MRMFVRYSRLSSVLAIAISAAAFGLVAGVPAQAVTVTQCTFNDGHSFTYTGLGEDPTNWNEAMNWTPVDNAPPKEKDSVTFEGSHAREVFLSANVAPEICNLTIGDNAFLETRSAGMKLNGDLDWSASSGGFNDGSHIIGSMTVGGTANLHDSGNEFNEGLSIEHYESGGTAVLKSLGEFDLSGATVVVADDTSQLEIDGIAIVGNGGFLGNSVSGIDPNGKVVIKGQMSLSGDVTAPYADINIPSNGTTAGSIDLHGHTLSLFGSTSHWKGGTVISSSGGPGVLKVGDGGDVGAEATRLMVDGAVTIGQDATLLLDGDTLLADGKLLGSSNGHGGVLKGAGVLDWKNGDQVGSIMLDTGFRTLFDGSGERLVNPGATLTNRGDALVRDGTLETSGDGQIENGGNLALCPDVRLFRNGTGYALVNDTGAIAGLLPAVQCPGTTTGTVEADHFAVLNHGTIGVPTGELLRFAGEADTLLADGGTLAGGGTIQIGDGDRFSSTGTTTLSQNTSLLIDGVGGGAGTAQLHGINGGGTLTADAANGGGTLKWVRGFINGTLSTDGDLRTEVTSDGPDAYHDIDVDVDDTSTTIHFGSPTYVTGTDMFVHPDAVVNIDGSFNVNGGGFTGPDSGTVIITPSGSFTASGAPAEISNTVHVNGLLAADATTLDVLFGYNQSSTGTTRLRNGATISADDGGGNVHEFTFDGGRVEGSGTLKAIVQSIGATVAPRGAGLGGTLTIDGDYAQGPGATLLAHVGGTAPSDHSILAVTGNADIAGTVTGETDASYQPTVGTVIPGVLSAATSTGAFKETTSTGTPVGSAWTARSNGTAVDLLLEYSPPDTTIDSAMIDRAHRTATFTFSSNDSDVTFKCQIDKAPFKPCSSGKTYRRLARGKHRFQVKSVNDLGVSDTSPAVQRFSI